MFYRDERLALFIDGANLYAAAKALGFDIDYKLLRTEFMRRGKLLRAFYYTEQALLLLQSLFLLRLAESPPSAALAGFPAHSYCTEPT